MAGTRTTRSGRQRANPTAATNTRQKEEAELQRVTRAVSTIPSYSSRFQLFRRNRRQRAKQLSELEEESALHAQLQPAIFRAARFSDLPLSRRTVDGLVAAGFTDLTAIQRNAIPQALAGRDVLAAAPTGSGKTLAFLVPLLEVLWRNKWNTFDGLGALILSPTRELSMQIFEVLRSIAKRHPISAGLVIGGKDFESEREKVGNMNVLVATPGRLLHHMDHVAELDCSDLKLLILDEADRILDMGFAKTLDAILMNLPKNRQTLLFSATQTKSIKALARLSLREPEYVAVASRETDEKKEGLDQSEKDDAQKKVDNSDIKIAGTPVGLSQSYAIVAAHDKLSVLWSFIKTHLKSKMIVFFSSGKQVRFAFEIFCKLRPGMSLLHLHGGMKQLKRTDMYDLFCRTKSAALFATDVASRGLDFPDVEWVIQVDCPADVGTYVHRVGRTARFKADGRAMLLLNEGKEEEFLGKLKSKELHLHRTKINPSRIMSIESRVAATVASSQELRMLAQRAFTFYVKSIYQQADKEVFDVTDLDFTRLANSFGLSIVPKIAIKGDGAFTQKTRDRKEKGKTVFGYRARSEQADKNLTDTEAPANGARMNVSVGEDSVEDDAILTIKKVHEAVTEGDGDGSPLREGSGVQPRKRKRRKLDLMKGLPSANRIVFTDDGKAVRAADVVDVVEEGSVSEVDHDGIDDYAATVSKRLALTAEEDKLRERTRVRSIHSKRKARERDPKVAVRQNLDHSAILTVTSDDDTSEAEHENLDDVTERLKTKRVPYLDTGSHTPDLASLADEEQLALRILHSRK